MAWDQIAFGAFSGQSIVGDALFVLLAGVLLFFGLRWGIAHEKRTLAIFFLAGSLLFLLLGLNAIWGLAISFPTPSQGWLTAMASNRAHFRSEYPAIDQLLITQGRMADLGGGILSLILTASLAGFGGRWLKKQTTAQ